MTHLLRIGGAISFAYVSACVCDGVPLVFLVVFLQ
jgi:hypothetical protein